MLIVHGSEIPEYSRKINLHSFGWWSKRASGCAECVCVIWYFSSLLFIFHIVCRFSNECNYAMVWECCARCVLFPFFQSCSIRCQRIQRFHHPYSLFSAHIASARTAHSENDVWIIFVRLTRHRNTATLCLRLVYANRANGQPDVNTQINNI